MAPLGDTPQVFWSRVRTNGSSSKMEHQVRQRATAQGVDVIAYSGALTSAPPSLVVTDVDSTLIMHEVIDELATYAGTRDQVARITDRAMRGELDFSSSLQERVATLAGLPHTVFLEVMNAIGVTPGAQNFINAVHRAHGTFGVVSGGFMEIVEPLAQSMGIDHCLANRLEIIDGTLTGRVLGEIVTAEKKATMVKKWASEAPGGITKVVALGDGANDIPMMHSAALGIAFCAKPAVIADVRNSLSLQRLDVLAPALGLTLEAADPLDHQ